MTTSARNSPNNLILLCRDHHKIVDDNEGIYSSDSLHTARLEYLAWLEGNLTPAEAWAIKTSSLAYLNLPRLSEFAVLNGVRLELPELSDGSMLSSLGIRLGQLMAALQRVLESISFLGINPSKIQYPHDGYVGQTIGFERLRFRTKNLPEQRKDFAFTGDLSIDPHIYCKFDNWTLVININPRWVTTSTAYCIFRPPGGASVLTGFARISGVDLENKVMTATGLAIGLPAPAIDIFNKIELQKKEADDLSDIVKLEDEVTSARGDIWHGDLECCDICLKQFNGEQYMIDGSLGRRGFWACMCVDCYRENRRPLGVGYGQLYRQKDGIWHLVGGYPRPKESENDEGNAEYDFD